MTLESKYGAPVAVVESNTLPVQGVIAAGQSGSAVNPLLSGVLDSAGNVQACNSDENADIILLPSLQRNAQTFTAQQINRYARGVVIFLIVTEASGTGGLEPTLLHIDPASGLAVNVWNLDAAPITSISNNIFYFYPNFSSSQLAAGQAVNMVLPGMWQFRIDVKDASNYTYSVGASYLK